MKAAAILAVVAGLAVSAVPPALAEPWTVDQDASLLGFVARQGGSPVEGRFTSFEAEIEFDPDDLEASRVSVAIDMASATTGAADRDSALPSAAWFDVPAFPEARFETTAFSRLDGNRFEAEATLTIRDVSREVVLPFTLEISGDVAHVVGELEILRTDYGVGQGQWESGDVVALEVIVVVDVTATRAQ